jgi:hypothetical protein
VQIVSLMGIMYMAQTSNPYYSNPGAISAVTAIVLAVIITSIVYFVVVVTVEVVVLCNEADRGKTARRASMSARSAGKLGGDKGAGTGSKRRMTLGLDSAAAVAAAAASGSAAGSSGPEEPAIGAVSNEMNPMFLSTRHSTVGPDGEPVDDGKVVDSATEAIMAMRDAPNQTMWVVFQQTYAETQAQLRAAQEQLVAAKVHSQKLEARLSEAHGAVAVAVGSPSSGAGAAAGGGGGSGRRGTTITKTAFAPSRSGGDADPDSPAGGEDDRMRALSAYRGGGGRTENPLSRRAGSTRRQGT